MDLFDRFNRIANQVGDLIGELSDEAKPHIELGMGLLERGDYDAAIGELSRAIEKRRDHARALYLLGLAHVRRNKPGDAALAKRWLEQALSAKDGYADAHLVMGDALRQGGEAQAAADAYRAALPLIDDAAERAEVERRLGSLYLELGQIEKAVRELRKAASAVPDDPSVQGLLGQALVKQAQRRGEAALGPTFEAARLCLSRAAKADHPDPLALAALGDLLLQADQVLDAEKALVRALRERPTLSPALISLGYLRLLQGDVASAYEQALRAHASLREQTGGDASVGRMQVQLLLARCHRKTGAHERALAAYELSAAELGPGAVDAQVQPSVAQILDEAIRLALASELYESALRVAQHPALAGSANALAARSFAPNLSHAEAEAILASARALGETVDVYLALAGLELRRGQRAAAATQLRRGAALDPLDPRPRKRLSELYQREREALPRDLYGLLHRTHQTFAQTPELSHDSPEAARIVELYDRPLLVTVMGEFNSGKSTFVNALLGHEVAPMGITPTTATINLLKYGREPGGRVLYRDGQSKTIPWSRVPALLRGLDPEEARKVELVEVLYPLDVLSRVNIIDTPGLNSILPEHEATARAFIAQADAVIWLFTVDQAGKQSERDALQSIREQGKKILGVLNKIDRLEQLTEGKGDGSAAGGIDLMAAPPPALKAILAHLASPDSGLAGLLETVVPFSGREALLGRQARDDVRMARANLPALEQALEERFFQRAQIIKQEAARGRLHSLLSKARAYTDRLLSRDARVQLEQSLRLLSDDSLLFQRDTLPAERKLLIADADTAHRTAARETLDFVRPRRWPFTEHQASPADRDFLLHLLDDKLSSLLKSSRDRIVEALRFAPTETDAVRLLDEQVYGRYRAFSRGFLRGGKVDEFFVRTLPKLDLTEAAIGRALEKDSPTAVELLEEELLSPLRSFNETLLAERTARVRQLIATDELRSLDVEERLTFPLAALSDVLQEMITATPSVATAQAPHPDELPTPP